MRRPALRALAAVAVRFLLVLTATSLHTSEVGTAAPRARVASSQRAELAARTQVLGFYDRASRSDRATPPPAPARPHKVRPAPGAITGTFGESRGHGRHPGLDIDGTTGDPVVAAMGGTIALAGPAPPGYAGYGNMILIDHVTGLQTLYAHLSAVNVQVGQHVEAGDLIGAIGSTGYSTGSHLHFEVRINGVTVDPAAWLNEP